MSRHSRHVRVISVIPLKADIHHPKNRSRGGASQVSPRPIEPASVNELRDTSHGMTRTEVHYTNGNGHLGYVFPDGPTNWGGMRYCINSASLWFIHRDDMEAEGYGAYLDQAEDIR